MKKLFLYFIGILVVLYLCGCSYSSNYEDGKTALASGDYNTAITLLTDLATENYKDSYELLMEAKYQYVQKNLDRDDRRSLIYLDELVLNGYKDSQSLYDDLFSWKADIAISTSKQSSFHKSDLNVTDLTFPFYYFNFRIHGGPPDGEFRGTYEIIFSNGQKISDEYIGSDNDFFFAITLSGTENPIGKTTFNVYGENQELLATATSTIY